MAPNKKKNSPVSVPVKNPYKSPAKSSNKSPSPNKPKRETIQKGGNVLNKYGDIVYVIRLKQNLRIAYVIKGNNRTKGSYIQHLVNLINNDDESVSHLGINAVLPRRAPDGSNNKMMDGIYPMRQFLQILNEDDDDSTEAAKTWGSDIAKVITNLNKTSQYPTTCTFGGDLTPPTGPPTVDTHLMNSDVVNIACHLYNNSIIDGSFFENVLANDDSDKNEETEALSKQFFGSVDDARSLFITNN